MYKSNYQQFLNPELGLHLFESGGSPALSNSRRKADFEIRNFIKREKVKDRLIRCVGEGEKK